MKWISTKKKGKISASVEHRRPVKYEIFYPIKVYEQGFYWELYPEELISTYHDHPFANHNQPWAVGPFCPHCIIFLEEKTVGYFNKKYYWRCPCCSKEYLKPEGDIRDVVEKNFGERYRNLPRELKKIW